MRLRCLWMKVQVSQQVEKMLGNTPSMENVDGALVKITSCENVIRFWRSSSRNFNLAPFRRKNNTEPSFSPRRMFSSSRSEKWIIVYFPMLMAGYFPLTHPHSSHGIFLCWWMDGGWCVKSIEFMLVFGKSASSAKLVSSSHGLEMNDTFRTASWLVLVIGGRSFGF